ncbi:hypothetical protein T03_13492 [Trichinella britovi]|uniref:Uncharacterized protein n=1 Tax=Trichinella britovi TaxID=45882 RepID=A0A0V0ZJI7_TRIBR|nr:hypothetical protein T03_13492 [Trichinella britovi]
MNNAISAVAFENASFPQIREAHARLHEVPILVKIADEDGRDAIKGRFQGSSSCLLQY